MPHAVIVLVGRVLLGLLFVLAAIAKLTDRTGTTAYFEDLGLPAPAVMTWASSLFELIAGLAVLVGYHTRPVAYLLAAFSVSAGYLGHFGQGGDDPMLSLMHTQAFQKDLAIGGAFLVLAVFGPGSLSVDGRLARYPDT